MANRDITQAVAQAAQPLEETAGRFDGLLKLVGNARMVLRGEASHGTHEFYEARAEITRRLITEMHFDAVAVEADERGGALPGGRGSAGSAGWSEPSA